jgi:hypothetical protein
VIRIPKLWAAAVLGVGLVCNSPGFACDETSCPGANTKPSDIKQFMREQAASTRVPSLSRPPAIKPGRTGIAPTASYFRSVKKRGHRSIATTIHTSASRRAGGVHVGATESHARLAHVVSRHRSRGTVASASPTAPAFAAEDIAPVQVVSSLNQTDQIAPARAGESAGVAMTNQDVQKLFAQAFNDVDRESSAVAIRVETASPKPEGRDVSWIQSMWLALREQIFPAPSAGR